MRRIFSALFAATLALFAVLSPGPVQAQSLTWTGTWNSQHGELRLIQDGSRVYGDYAERGTFEGRVSDDGTRLRGTFQYNSPRSSHGYIEFQRRGNSFTGGWNWARSGPVAASKGNWTGSLRNAAIPQLRHAVGRDDYWADFWPDAGAAAREWSLAGVTETAGYGSGDDAPAYQYETVPYPAYPAPDQSSDSPYPETTAPVTGPWTGTFSTNHGDIRLIQIGNRVFGDYAARGFFEGCVRDGGQTLRGTFQYLSPRSKHGFIEFRLNDDSFEGTWTWTRSGVPGPGSAINWRGTRRSGDAPTLNQVSADESHFADMWNTISASQRAWVLGQTGADQCTGGSW